MTSNSPLQTTQRSDALHVEGDKENVSNNVNRSTIANSTTSKLPSIAMQLRSPSIATVPNNHRLDKHSEPFLDGKQTTTRMHASANPQIPIQMSTAASIKSPLREIVHAPKVSGITLVEQEQALNESVLIDAPVGSLLANSRQLDTEIELNTLNAANTNGKDQRLLRQFVYKWQDRIDSLVNDWPVTDQTPDLESLLMQLVEQTQTNLFVLGHLMQQEENETTRQACERVQQLEQECTRLKSALQEYALLYEASRDSLP